LAEVRALDVETVANDVWKTAERVFRWGAA
jgi:Tat protein secretion system quality control protein TatD with DNase activity